MDLSKVTRNKGNRFTRLTWSRRCSSGSPHAKHAFSG